MAEVENGKKCDKQKTRKKTQGDLNHDWKWTGAKERKATPNKFGTNTYHWCHKDHGKYKKTMWALLIPKEHTGFTLKTIPKTDDMNLEANDEGRYLLSFY